MVAILKKWLDTIDVARYIRDLRKLGYTQGSWAWIPGTDKLEIRTWRFRVKK